MATATTTEAPALVIAMKSASPSNNVHSYGYDAPTQTLDIKFLSGATYRYEGVPAEVATKMETEKSKGSYVSMAIRGKYKTACLVPKPEKKAEGA